MKSRKLMASLLAVTMMTSSILVGCGGTDNKKDNNKKDTSAQEDKDKDGDNKEAKIDKEQYINTLLGAEPKTVDPSKASDTISSEIFTNTMETLTRLEEDETGKLVVSEGVAKEWKQSEDGLKWTFTLRDSNWSDGKPVTVDDFIYSFTRTLDPKTASQYAQILYYIKNGQEFNKGKAKAEDLGLKKIDDHTLEIELAAPCSYFLDLTYFKTLVPQRKDIVEKYGDKYGTDKDNLIYNGPFIISDWKHDNELVLEKNPEYWDKDAVKLDKVTMKIIQEESSRMNEALNGNLDTLGVSKPEWVEKFEATGEYNVKNDFDGGNWYMAFNQQNKYFKNAKIRKAISLALDREGYVKTVDRGIPEVATACCPPRVNIGEDEYREVVKKDYIEELKKENEGKAPKDLLVEGLKEIKEDPDPSKVTIKLLAQDGGGARSKESAEYMQANLMKELGINVKVDLQKFAIFQKLMDNLDYDMVFAGWHGDYNDPNTFFEIFKSDSTMQRTAWKNEEYDKLLDKAASTIDQKERLKIFEQAEEILLVKDAVISPMTFGRTNTYVRKYVNKYSKPTWSQRDFKHTYTSGREK